MPEARTNNPAEAPENGEPTPAEHAESARKPSRLVLILLWTALVLGCMSGGVLLSLLLRKAPSGAQKEGADLATSRQTDPNMAPNFPPNMAPNPPLSPLPESAVSDAQAIAEAQKLLREELNPQGALQWFRQVLQRVDRPPLHVVLESTVCLELTGQHREALAHYHELHDRAPTSTMRLLAVLGATRCETALGQLGTASATLYELALSPDVAERTWAASEVAHGLSTALNQPLVSTPNELLLEDAVPAPPVFATNIRNVIGLLKHIGSSGAEPEPQPQPARVEPRQGQGQEARRRKDPYEEFVRSVNRSSRVARVAYLQEPAPNHDGIKKLFQLSPKPNEIQFKVDLPATSTLPLVESLLDMAKIRPIWSPSARSVLMGRTSRVKTASMSLATLLDCLTRPMGVEWEFDEKNGVIQFDLRASLDADARGKLYYAAAVRAAQRATAAYPEHPAVPSALLTLGNLLLMENQRDAAAAQYDLLIRRYGQTESAPAAWFNLAKSHLLSGRSEASLTAFYRVFDGSRGGELRAISALYVGRLHLEQDQFKQANRVLQRSRSMSHESAVRASATILQSITFLQTGNPHAANRALMDYRSDLALHQRDTAALLSAMARFQTAVNDQERLIQGRSLVGALSHVKPSQFFGKYGAVLLGEAYAELGLYEEMAGAYDIALQAGIQGATAQRMQLALARVKRDQGDLEDAKSLYQALVTVKKDGANHAKRLTTPQQIGMIEQAELEYQMGRYGSCIHICRSLVTELDMHADDPTSLKQRVLAVMGRTYQRMGKHELAALCFSGILPDPPSDAHTDAHTDAPKTGATPRPSAKATNVGLGPPSPLRTDTGPNRPRPIGAWRPPLGRLGR